MTSTDPSESLRSSLRGVPGPAASPLRLIESTASIVRCRRGQKLYSAGDRTEHWHRVVSGILREWALLSDGRRHIIDFLLPGDFFGFSAHREHRLTVEAVVSGTVVARYPRRSIELLAEADSELRGCLLDLALESISRLQSRTLMLGRLSAQQKVGSFLTEMAERSSQEPGVVVLPMSRYDIADYLALSVETVSRALTHLKLQGAIALADAHRVKILDRDRLEQRQPS